MVFLMQLFWSNKLVRDWQTLPTLAVARSTRALLDFAEGSHTHCPCSLLSNLILVLLALSYACAALPLELTGDFQCSCPRFVALAPTVLRCRVAIVENGSARLIEITDIVTYDDELSPLQVVNRPGMVVFSCCVVVQFAFVLPPLVAEFIVVSCLTLQYSLLSTDLRLTTSGMHARVLPPTETQFTNATRRVSHICEETLAFLKQTKHKAWRDGMLGIFGNCAKAFIPSLKQGLITRMSDCLRCCAHSGF